jgi:SAM-dependent methyltransferase
MTDVERAARIEALEFDPGALSVESVERCNLCGGQRFIQAAVRDRYGYGTTYEVCASCGLGFLSPRLTIDGYGEFYERVYRPLVSAYHGRLIDARTVQVEQAEYGLELAAFLRTALPAPPTTVLDVGGSTGVVAAMIRDAFGSQPTVLDPSPDELAAAAEQGMETVAGFAETADLSDRRFDLVLLCQTIDHLLDIAGTLRSIRKWVGNEGYVFVDVLDVNFMLHRRGAIEGAVKIDHPYYLTRATALAYFELAGLEPVAERLSEDGHWGFVLVPGPPHEPDWTALRRAADRHLDEIWALRARA